MKKALILALGLLAVVAMAKEKVYSVTVYDAVTVTNDQVLASSAVEMNVYRPDWQAMSFYPTIGSGTGVATVIYQTSVDGITFADSATIGTISLSTDASNITFTPVVTKYLRFKATGVGAVTNFTAILNIR